MIALQPQHTQGDRPMKGATNRQNRRGPRLGTIRLGTLAVLLPLALGSTAQTSLHWSSEASSPVATVTTTPVRGVSTVANTPRQIAYVPPPRQTMPLASGFDVHQ